MIGMMMPPGGVPAPAASPAPAAPAPQPAPDAQTPPAAQQGPTKVANANRTMIGVQFNAAAAAASAAQPIAQQAPAAPAGGLPAKVANANQTMVGVTLQPPPGAAPLPAMAPQAPIAAAPQAPQAPQQPFAQQAPIAPIAPASAAGTPAQGVSKTGTNNQTDLYSPTASPRSKTVPLQQPAPGYEAPISIPGMPSASKPKRSIAPVLGLLAAALLVGGGVLVALNLRAKKNAAPLAAAFEAGADGARVLAVRVPDAPSNASLRFESQEVPIRDGVARLPATVVGDRVGRVDLPVQIVGSNASPSPRTAQVVIGYVVRPELEGLGQNPPTARLSFRVPAGAQLKLDGQPVQTDAEGRGIAAINDLRPIPAGETQLQHSFAIRVQSADGTVVEGTYRFELPRTNLAIERPSRLAIKTASARVAIRVRAAGASAVVIDGQPATRDGDAFVAAVDAPATSARTIEVRAFRAQFAPALATVEIERLTADARGLARLAIVDSSVCAEGNDGSNVTVRGTVIGSPRQFNGGTTFQLVAQDRRCPRGSAPLWIDAEPDITVREGETLRVSGALSGTRTALTGNGERRTDRVLHAAIVQR